MKAAFTFHKPITEGLGVTDWNDSLFPKLNGKPLPIKNETIHEPGHPPGPIGLSPGNRWKHSAF